MDQASPVESPYRAGAGRAYLIGVALFIFLLLAAAGVIAVLLRASALSEAVSGRRSKMATSAGTGCA